MEAEEVLSAQGAVEVHMAEEEPQQARLQEGAVQHPEGFHLRLPVVETLLYLAEATVMDQRKGSCCAKTIPLFVD